MTNRWTSQTGKSLTNDYSRLKITVELLNFSNFPITLNGEITIKNSERSNTFGSGNDYFLFPGRPAIIDVYVPIADGDHAVGPVPFLVGAKFSHFHRITKKPIIQRLLGKLDCGIANGEWQANFTPFMIWVQRQMEPKNKRQTRPTGISVVGLFEIGIS